MRSFCLVFVYFNCNIATKVITGYFILVNDVKQSDI